MSKMESKKDGIVINRMYAGNYLDSNIGHEVINLFAADNGCHYLYLNAIGNFAEEHKDRINWMVLVKRHCSGVDEIVGLAEGLTDVYVPDKPFNDKQNIDEEIRNAQESFCKNEGGVTYGGVSIFNIFGKTGQQSIYITYKAEKLVVPKDKRLFISYASSNNVIPGTTNKDEILRLGGHKQANTSLKQYIYPSDNIDDYGALVRFFEDNSLWEKSDGKADVTNLNDMSNEESIFDICCIQNNENCFSNALAYYMSREKYQKLWVEFFKRYSISLDENYLVEREADASIEDSEYKKKHPELSGGGRIDLLIRDESNIIVVENKIKSDINKIESDKDGDQLERYFNYVNWLLREKCHKKPHFFVLAPNYNVPKISDKMDNIYKIITYKDLYDFLTIADIHSDANFEAFYNAIRRHTFDNICDYLYYEMKNKFFRQIKDKQTVK